MFDQTYRFQTTWASFCLCHSIQSFCLSASTFFAFVGFQNRQSFFPSFFGSSSNPFLRYQCYWSWERLSDLTLTMARTLRKSSSRSDRWKQTMKSQNVAKVFFQAWIFQFLRDRPICKIRINFFSSKQNNPIKVIHIHRQRNKNY